MKEELLACLIAKKEEIAEHIDAWITQEMDISGAGARTLTGDVFIALVREILEANQ